MVVSYTGKFEYSHSVNPSSTPHPGPMGSPPYSLWDLSGFINTVLDFDRPLSPGKEQAQNALESKWLREQGIQKGRKMGKVGCQYRGPSGVRQQHGDPTAKEGTQDNHAPPSLGWDESGACTPRGGPTRRLG